jgi:zinc/manganese transport system substrate-binding protein
VIVGPNSDVHVFAPTPADARTIAAARAVFINGLGLEGWMTRLIAASGSGASPAVVSRRVEPLQVFDEKHPGRRIMDPHAWQSVGNAEIYVANIRHGLKQADPAGASAYDAAAQTYTEKLKALDRDIRAAIATIPVQRRKLVTTHDAFGYFAAAYGVEFISPQGAWTDAEPSARDFARIVMQVRREKIPAVFLENIVDPRLMQQLVRETGVRIGGTLYSDALSGPSGPAATYIEMMRSNVRKLTKALAP